MKIGFISRILPCISETFVCRELKALRGLGLEIAPISVHQPKRNEIQEEAKDIFDEVSVIMQPANPMFWLSHFLFLFSHPVRYFATFFDAFFAEGLSLKQRFRAWQQFLLAANAARVFRKLKLTHVHAHFANIPTSMAMMASRLAGISYSFTIHSYGLFCDNLLLRQKLQRAAFVSTVSHYNQRYLEEHYPGAAEEKTHVIRCGLPLERFRSQVVERPIPPLILSIGRLVELKGFHTLIESCRIMRDDGIEYQCIIVGDGPEREKLKRQIEAAGLEDRVQLVGKKMQEEVRELFSRASVFALACCVRKYQDNLPVVLVEALAMGVPAISTRLTAIPEILQHNKTGIIIEPDEPNQLSEAIKKILNNPAFAEDLIDNGRQYVEQEFDIRKCAKRLKMLLESTHEEHERQHG